MVSVPTEAVLYHLQACQSRIDAMETVSTRGSLAPLSPSSPPATVTQSGEAIEVTSTPPLQEPRRHLNPFAHRRWKASTSVEFLTSIKHVDIIGTHVNPSKDRAVVYDLEVHLKRPTSRLAPQPIPSTDTDRLTFVVARSFSDFSELRDGVKTQ